MTKESKAQPVEAGYMCDDEIVERMANAMFRAQDASKKFRCSQSVKQRMSEYRVSEMCQMAGAALTIARKFSASPSPAKVDDAMVERVAMAIYFNRYHGATWGTADEAEKQRWKLAARAAIQAMKEE